MRSRSCLYVELLSNFIFVVSNAIQTIDNYVRHLIIYCLNCIRRNEIKFDIRATYKLGQKLAEKASKDLKHVALTNFATQNFKREHAS